MLTLLVLLVTAAPPAATARPVESPLPPPPAGTSRVPAAAAPPPAAPAATPAATPPPPPQRLSSGSTGGALRVAFLDPRVQGDVPARPLAAFIQAMVPELRKLEGVSAIGMAEIKDMLGFERQRQMLGCAADEECLTEIAGALGVDELVTTEIVLVGRKYTYSSRRLDLRKARVLGGMTRTFDARDGEELLAVVGTTVEELYRGRALKPGKERGVERAVIRRLNPPPLPRWVFWATAGSAAAFGGAAIGTGLLAADSRKEFRRVADRSATEPVSGAELNALEDEVRSRDRLTNVFLATAAGLAVAAGVEAFFTDWHDDRRALATPVALPGGVGVAVLARF